jgi:hypothetical protein
MEVRIRLGRTDVIHRMKRVVTGGHGLSHADVAGRGVEGRSGHGSHCRGDGITTGADGDLGDGGKDGGRRDARIQLAALDEVVDGLVYFCGQKSVSTCR